MSNGGYVSKAPMREGMGFLGAVSCAIVAGGTIGKIPLHLSERLLPGRPILQVLCAVPFTAMIVVCSAAIGRGVCEGAVEGMTVAKASTNDPRRS
jgi:hypothetical protein